MHLFFLEPSSQIPTDETRPSPPSAPIHGDFRSGCGGADGSGKGAATKELKRRGGRLLRRGNGDHHCGGRRRDFHPALRVGRCGRCREEGRGGILSPLGSIDHQRRRPPRATEGRHPSSQGNITMEVRVWASHSGSQGRRAGNADLTSPSQPLSVAFSILVIYLRLLWPLAPQHRSQ